MIRVGIIGLGTVGLGTYRLLKEHRPLIAQRTGLDIVVAGAAEIDSAKRSEADEGPRFFKTAEELIDDPSIEMIVELIGGTETAGRLVTSAFGRGKWVVTANKALLAEKGNEIFRSAAESGCEIGFEASVCGGIPVIRAIRDGLVGNKIGYILGILNGTSNYILTRMSAEKLPFAQALAEAQAAGFAEADPTFDVEGIDAAHKLCILARLAFGYPLSMADIGTGGISRIEPIDIAFAEELGYRIKLLAVASDEDGVIEARAVPAMLPAGHLMSSVSDVYNAVYIVGDRVGPNLYYGKGAGADPTASAVVSDIVDMALRKSERCGRPAVRLAVEGRRVKKSRESVASFYVRLRTEDSPGVLSRVSGILADHRISIAAVTQKGRGENEYVPIVMLTHEAAEGDLLDAKAEIDGLPFISGESIHVRIEPGHI